MSSQVEFASAAAGLLLHGRYHRVNHVAPHGRYTMDDARPATIDELTAVGRATTELKLHADAIKRFVDGQAAAPYVPLAAAPGPHPGPPRGGVHG